MEKNITTKVITGKCRASYAYLWEPTHMNETDPLKYSVRILIPKTDKATLAKIEAAVKAATDEGIKKKWNGKLPPASKLKLPLRDGDEEFPGDPVHAGCMFVNAYSRTRPGIVDLVRNPIVDREEVYSGCYCRFSINFYPFGGAQSGVACGLNNVQKVADGEPLAGRSRAEDDFGDDYTGDLDDIL